MSLSEKAQGVWTAFPACIGRPRRCPLSRYNVFVVGRFQFSEGEIEGEQVTCPWHGALFNIKTGEVLARIIHEDREEGRKL